MEVQRLKFPSRPQMNALKMCDHLSLILMIEFSPNDYLCPKRSRLCLCKFYDWSVWFVSRITKTTEQISTKLG